MQKNNFKLVQEWALKAQSDLRAAEILYKEDGPTDSVCFHCHQAAEKMLKGFLVFKKGDFPKIHDLIQLLNLGKKIDRNLEAITNETSFLNRYYIETRYPPEIMVYSKEECKKALKSAETLIQFVIDKISI